MKSIFYFFAMLFIIYMISNPTLAIEIFFVAVAIASVGKGIMDMTNDHKLKKTK